MKNKKDILKGLGLDEINVGACSGYENWYDNEKTKVIHSINPATTEIIASVKTCSELDYDKIMNRSITASLQWRTVPAPKRGEIVRCIGEALREKKDFLGSLVTMETGKLKEEGDGEVQEMIDMADFAVGQSRMLYGKTMNSERPLHRMYEQWHPLGVVGVITAFNFPVAVWAWNAFIAVIAGNTVVWKPSSTSPLCTIAVQKICNDVLRHFGFEGVFSFFIPESNVITDKFVCNNQVPLVSFTGSTSVGKRVLEKVAKRFGKSLLELSGNNAVIITASADLDIAIPAVVFGAIGTTGQRCTTTRRVFIHESIYEEVILKLIKAYKKISIDDPMDKTNLMGPLISSEMVLSHLKVIASLKKKGDNILYGGDEISATGFYVQPTIVAAKNDWQEVQQETFSPILYVMKYKDLESAIELQNDVPQGLSSAIFTNNIRESELFLSCLGSDCGIANVNIGTSGAEIGGAFGGEKETGGGREAGSDSWKAYMRRQTTTINWGSTLPLAQGVKYKT